MASYETIRLINTVLTLYYVEGLTQTEIAQRLGLSTAKVNRLLVQAREQGYVNITIRTPFQHLFELEDRLKAVFGLTGCNCHSVRGRKQQLVPECPGHRGSRLFAGSPAGWRCIGHRRRHDSPGRRPGD